MSKEKVSVWDAKTWQTYKRLLGYTRRFRTAGLIAILGMIVDPVCLSLFTSLLKPLIDNLFVDKDPYTIFWMPIWIIAIFAVRGVASYATDYGIAYVGRNVVQAIRIDVFASYLRLPAAFFAKEPSGQQISRITYTSEQVASASADSLKMAITEGLTVVGMLCVMLYWSAYLAMALLVLVPCVVVIVTVISRRYRKISKRIQGNMGSVTSAVEEAVAANREVRIYGGQTREGDRFSEIAERQRRLNLKISATSAASGATIQTVGAVALATLVFLGTRPGIIETITPGIFTAVLTAMGGMLPSLKRLAGIQANLQKGVTAAEDLFEIIDTPAEVDTGTEDLVRTRGDIRFENIHLVYERNHHVALRGVDLVCKPGTVTALVGRSGSGKSSLVSLLPRFYQPTEGRILVDGRDYSQYTLPSLRRQIAWVGQNVVLFDDTVAANIAYGEMAGASEADIVAAAKAANAMEFIERLPDGLQTQIGQGGNSLSGGQRQRIAIARAILKNAPILVLDEATSSLDTESERLIQDALTRLMRDRTTLVIAHRLSTIEHADQIAVMDQGRVVELGTHRELIESGGQYAALHRMQFHDQAAS
ncbi:MAG TPA: lipid A export permease/ATP-binding protein MsbA [Luteibacter sp.]|uniref:lipid A export permease/ATP-binding protein MsbA n=1 Tax=Luteibacter sp. TaxID=1886636 RepID=UPI002CC6316F|nr:lipid A export permease/ATP-binding protein MsbA [Luteibacter sp.]HVI56366.1 lipid A export permease/ATP-binding protein MsbA [Luteibacter sp.]